MQARSTALLDLLRRRPEPASALTQALGLSRATLSRLLKQLRQQDQVFAIRSGRQIRYGARRRVRSIGSAWPLYRIDTNGAVQRFGDLTALEPRHYHLSGPSAVAGMTDALPYLLQDLRPAGFLGRQIPAQHPQLNVPPRIGDWNDAHTLEYLVRLGSDLPGDLVLGEEALERSVCPQASVAAMAPQERADCYAQLVQTGQICGSPAPVHGEQPKFTVRLAGSEPTSLIVKFSPPLKDPAGRRWADLLVAEHLALETLSEAGLPAARSAILESAGRCYLEVQRFDRVGSTGRRGTVSLLAVDAARFGELDRWSRAAARLCAERAFSREDVERVRRLEAFAILIRNTDRHFGNLSLFDDYTGVFALAPIYDMLPMAYAPHADGHVPDAANAPLPTAETAEGWSDSSRLAKAYWRRVAEDTRVSASFRDLADRHAAE